MPDAPNVRLTLSSRAENVLLVRQTLNGVAEAIGLDPLELNDISTAVSEACNNVALHAYGDGEGPLELEIHVRAGTIAVLVRDEGVGIRPRIDGGEPGGTGGIGLPIMLALAHSVEFSDGDGNGTEVRLEFATTAGAIGLDPPAAADTGPPFGDAHDPRDVTAITLAPSTLARTVLPRLLSALAARAFFSTDRISDTQRVADALLAHTDDAVDGTRLSVDIAVAPRTLDVRIGPLRSGRIDALVEDPAADGLGSVLTRLAESHEVSATGSSEVLALRLGDDGVR